MQGHVGAALGHRANNQTRREAGWLRSIERVGYPLVPTGGYGWSV